MINPKIATRINSQCVCLSSFLKATCLVLFILARWCRVSNDVCPYRFSSTFHIHQSGKIDWGVRKYAIASLLAENQSQRVSKTSSCVQLGLGQTSGCGRVLAVLVYRTYEVAKRKRTVWELIWDSPKKKRMIPQRNWKTERRQTCVGRWIFF